MSESYPPQNPPAPKPLLSDRAYRVLKWAAAVGLPALATFYFTFAQTWDLPHAEAVVGSMVAFNTFLGMLLGISTKSYNNVRYDGDVEISKNEAGTTIYGLELNRQPESFNPNEMIFRVVNRQNERGLS